MWRLLSFSSVVHSVSFTVSLLPYVASFFSVIWGQTSIYKHFPFQNAVFHWDLAIPNKGKTGIDFSIDGFLLSITEDQPNVGDEARSWNSIRLWWKAAEPNMLIEFHKMERCYSTAFQSLWQNNINRWKGNACLRQTKRRCKKGVFQHDSFGNSAAKTWTNSWYKVERSRSSFP